MKGLFTAHYNWDWVVREAFSNPKAKISCSHCCRASSLPSSKGQKAPYALFRLDVLENTEQEENVIRIRMDSPAMERLDPKDLLYRLMVTAGMVHYAPRTHLIPWDRPELCEKDPIPTHPAMLKAPLGSGGFGLYFVYHPRDAMEVMRNHRRRAERDPKFLSSVLQSYNGQQLCWSIQELIKPVLCKSPESGDLRRSQVRLFLFFALFGYDNLLILY